MAKKRKPAESNIKNVEQALGRTENFIEENQKPISIAIIALIVIVGGYWAYIKLYKEPRNAEAQQLVYHAQDYFDEDDYETALEGDGINPGFLEIIDEYGNTKIGNLSKYYAGISYLHIGEFDEALHYLKKFKTKNNELKAISSGAIGDAYLELDDKFEALKWYEKAVSIDHDITTPFYLLKKGILNEAIGNSDQALLDFTTIKEKYQDSAEAQQIDKYIIRVNLQN